MQQGFSSIAFTTNDGNGLSYISGISKFSSAGIIIEFEKKLFNIIRNGIKEIRLPLEEILDVKFKKGIFKSGAKIEIRLHSLAKLTELPNKNGRLTLKIVREDYTEAEQAVAKLQKDLSEFQKSLPPTRTPVSSLFDDSEDELKRVN